MTFNFRRPGASILVWVWLVLEPAVFHIELREPEDDIDGGLDFRTRLGHAFAAPFAHRGERMHGPVISDR